MKKNPSPVEEKSVSDEIKEVVVDDQKELETPEVKPDPKPELPQPDSRFEEYEEEKKKLERDRNALGFQNRKLEEELKRQKELLERIQRQTEKPVSVEDDFERESEKVAESDWKKAVDMRAKRIAEEKIKEILEKRDQEAQLRQTQQQTESVFEQSKSEVITRHPELLDENSEKFKAYTQVINENPELLRYPTGPKIAMRLMETRFTSQPQEEVDRLKRVAAGSVTTSRINSSVPGKIPLSKEQQEFCKANGIKFEAYAKSLSSSSKGEVS